jgi:hypothetical protein
MIQDGTSQPEAVITLATFRRKEANIVLGVKSNSFSRPTSMDE